MNAVDPRTLPARPPSEVEWEDLLVRLDIAPRALRVALEERAGPAARQALAGALQREAELQRALEAMVDGGETPTDGVVVDATGSAEALLDEVIRLRRRSFAMVQRRGLGVWEWTLRDGPYAGATSYQLLQAAAAMDGAVLAAIREGGAAA